MGGKHYYSFRYQANMLNIGHMDLTVHNAVLLDVWWNMLIKFSKQIGKSFSKTINGYLANSKLCQTFEMELSASRNWLQR